MPSLNSTDIMAIGSAFTAIFTVVLVFIYLQNNKILRQSYRPVIIIKQSNLDSEKLAITLSNVGHGIARKVKLYGMVFKSKGPTGYFKEKQPTQYGFRKFAHPDSIPANGQQQFVLPVKYGDTGELGEVNVFYDDKEKQNINVFTEDGKVLFDFGSVSLNIERELTPDEKVDFRRNWALLEMRVSYTDVEGKKYDDLLSETIFKAGITNLQKAVRMHHWERSIGMPKLLTGQKLTGLTEEEFDKAHSPPSPEI